jgi:hypothetical protein
MVGDRPAISVIVPCFNAAAYLAEALGDIVLRGRIHGANIVIREKAKQSDYLHILKASLDRRRRHGTRSAG